MKLYGSRLVGMGLIGAGLVFNPMVLGWLFRAGGTVGSTAGKLFVIGADCLAVLPGYWIVSRRDPVPGRQLLFAGLLCAACIVSVEGGLHLVRVVRDKARGVDLNKRLSLSVYRNEPWAPTVFQEYEDLKLEFEQYLCWRTSVFDGQYTHVDPEGFRATPDGGMGRDGTRELVIFFGGSSIWGAYVRDDQTVPYFYSRVAADAGRPVEAVNSGERGYTFTQGVVHLALLLRKGVHPNRVVFVDGYNDLISAYHVGQSGMVGLFPQLTQLTEQMRAPLRIQIGETLSRWLPEHCMIYKALGGLASLLDRPHPPSRDSLSILARGIADDYAASYSLLENLASAYHFTFTCFLQPTLFTKSHLSNEEAGSDPVLTDENFRFLCLEATQHLRDLNLPNLQDLSSVFDGDTSTVFSDVVHLSPAGNRTLAGVLFMKTQGSSSW